MRFEGEYVPVGRGGSGGTPRIFEWALNVTDPNKTCNYCLFSETPPQTKCPGPTLKSPPTDVLCSYIPDGNPLFRIMYVHIRLKEGDAPGVDELFSGLSETVEGWYLPYYPDIPDVAGDKTESPSTQKPCEKCHTGTVSGYDISFPPLQVTSWVSEIFIATWKEMPTNAGPKTLTAMEKHHGLVLQHETKHHTQFIDLYAKPLMNAIDNLNATYHYEYCSLAFEGSDMAERALKDADMAYSQRRKIVIKRLESWDAYEAAAAALDVIDYPLIDTEMPTDIRIKD